MVRIGVYNQGTSASGPFTVQWWPGENYGAPACSWTLDGMVARGGQILTCTYEGYPSWYGKINTKVVADPAGTVAESDESNNVYKKTISVSKPGSAPSGGSSPSGGSAPSGSGGVSGSPDLFISEFSMTPETPTQGSPVTVRVGVYNKGNSASGPFTVQWWPGENYGAPACSWTLDGMVARGGQILTCTYEGYPSWYAKIDTKVVADPAGEVAESDESNNVYKKTISVSKPGSAPSDGSAPPGGSSPSWSESQIGSEDSAPPSDSASSGGFAPPGSSGVSGSPDLFISEFSMTPETPTQGSPVTVRVGVYNKGNSASGPFTVQWWPGENYGAPACSWTLDGMVARGGRILTCTYEGYPSWYAKINTKVVADPTSEVAESDESNNVYKKTISVSKPGSAPSGGSSPSGGSVPSGSSGVSGSPDLFISEFSMTPETPTQGSPVTVRVGVYNKGNSASGPFTVQWWPGENYGAPACSWTQDGMVARGGRILTCTYEGYPSWYAKINTKVVADTAGAVAESDESNNVYKKTISVNRP